MAATRNDSIPCRLWWRDLSIFIYCIPFTDMEILLYKILTLLEILFCKWLPMFFFVLFFKLKDDCSVYLFCSLCQFFSFTGPKTWICRKWPKCHWPETCFMKKEFPPGHCFWHRLILSRVCLFWLGEGVEKMTDDLHMFPCVCRWIFPSAIQNTSDIFMIDNIACHSNFHCNNTLDIDLKFQNGVLFLSFVFDHSHVLSECCQNYDALNVMD